jgi:quercetin dioxygenase-like cupin family protein
MGPALRKLAMEVVMANRGEPEGAELPASAYPYHHQIFASTDAAAPTGILFDSKTFAVMAIAQPADSEMPDVNVDKDGDRILIVISGDLSLQIGESRFRLGPGDAVQIPRGARFGKSHSITGAHLLLIRGKVMRSFSMYR